jgi:hypothetical protein
MGGFASQVQQPQTGGGGKGQAPTPQAETQPTPVGSQQQQYQQPPQPMGKGGAQTNSATSGQPRMGQENQYSNTVGQWDNSQIQPVQRQGGKGKGA